jgi:Leucine-rich repeat (LRR) protein
MTTEIETYLNSLSEDILKLNISSKGIKSLPDLTRFKNLEELDCSNNQLTSLPTLPQNLKILYCSGNQLSSLPMLSETLERLFCSNNQLTSLPTLPQNLKELYCYNNPIYKIVNGASLFQIKKNVQIINNFRNLYYC